MSQLLRTMQRQKKENILEKKLTHTYYRYAHAHTTQVPNLYLYTLIVVRNPHCSKLRSRCCNVVTNNCGRLVKNIPLYVLSSYPYDCYIPWRRTFTCICTTSFGHETIKLLNVYLPIAMYLQHLDRERIDGDFAYRLRHSTNGKFVMLILRFSDTIDISPLAKMYFIIKKII